MAAASGSETGITPSRLKVASSSRKKLLEDKSSEDMRLLVENEIYPWSTVDARLWNMLNDNLVEKVIARLPFKSLFRASLLSKTWSQKILSRPSSFESEVLGCSTSTWPSYSPVFAIDNLLFANDKLDLIGYESGSQRWHKLGTHSCFSLIVEEEGPRPSMEERAWIWRLNLMAVGGSIFCWMWTSEDACECIQHRHPPRSRTPFYPFYLCVSNPITKSWKQLPPCPDMKVEGCGSEECMYKGINVHVDCQGTNTYQVVLVKWTKEKNKMWDVCVYIFDSGVGTWTMDTYKMKSHRALAILFCESVYINGVIYLGRLRVDAPNLFSLISFDLQKKMWSEQNLAINEQEQKCYEPFNFWGSLSHVKLVVCGSNVMLVVYHKEVGKISVWEDLCVYTLDLEFGLAFAVSTAPTDILDLFMREVGWHTFYCAAGGDCIYLSDLFYLRRSLMYNVTTRKWDWIPPPAPDKLGPFPHLAWRKPSRTSKAYQPGLNPFLEV